MDIRKETENFFKNGGLLSHHFENYEHRQSQLEMALAIADTLETKTHLLVEAPTGVGKSFCLSCTGNFYSQKI